MKDIDTAAIRAETYSETHEAIILGLCDALDEAREIRRHLRRRLNAEQARLERIRELPRFPDDDDPTVRYVLASDLDEALWRTA